MTYKETVIKYIEKYVEEAKELDDKNTRAYSNAQKRDIEDLFYSLFRQAVNVLEEYLPNFFEKFSLKAENIKRSMDL